MNWMRSNLPPNTSATVFTVSVFARPGTPSISRWPPASRQTNTRSSISSWPGDDALDLEDGALEQLRGRRRRRALVRCPWSVNLAPSWWPAAIQSRLAGEAEARLNRGCELPKRAGGDRAESRTCARVVDSGEAAERDRALGSGAAAGRGGQLVDGRVDDCRAPARAARPRPFPRRDAARSASGSRGRRASPRSTRRPSANGSVISTVAGVPARSTLIASCRLHDEQAPQSPRPAITRCERAASCVASSSRIG